MNRNTLPPAVAAFVAAIFLSSSTLLTAAGAERHEHKVITAKQGGSLTFKAAVGAIEIKTHAQDEVVYDAELKPGGGWFGGGGDVAEKLEFVYEQAEGNVKITMKWKDDKQPRNVSLNARHTLLIPAGYSVDVKTAGGGIEGVDINGTVAAQTSSGSIRFGKVNGEIKARTSGGSVTVADVEGNVEVKTSGGSIQVGNVAGNVAASTSGGGIKLGAVTGEVKGSTSGGSISAELAAQIAQPLDLSTSGGGIKLAVPGDFKADLDARTSGGNVDCELPIQGTIKRNSINGKVNGGGPKVTLHTSGGSIKVAKR